MKLRLLWFAGVLLAAPAHMRAQSDRIQAPASIEAGSGFSIHTAGSGKATLFIVGQNQVVKREVQMGQDIWLAPGVVHNAGAYLLILKSNDSTDTAEMSVSPENKPSDLSFLARPSRLPVGIHDGITGAVYVFDAYNNLITAPQSVTFELSNPAGVTQSRTVTTRNGAAQTEMDSTQQQGADKFAARTAGVESKRVVAQVPGDPCGIKMSAKPSGEEIELATEPLRDCSGNAVPDGTIVTFTETYGGDETTVDVPLKRGIAQVSMPAHNGAMLSSASGVVLGNQIRWEGQ